MPTRSKNSEYYAVIRGFYIAVPTIFSSWGDTHPIVTGFSKPDFCGFKTLAEAEDYMHRNSVTFYEYNIKHGAGKTNPRRNRKAYYAVANGRSPGIQEYYYGRGGTEPEVANFPGACHKRFQTEIQAKSFIADWIEMFACVAEDKKDADKVEHELTDGVKRLTLGSSE